MTIPGPVVEQPAVPARRGVERVRGAGGREDSGTNPEDAQAGFSDVMQQLGSEDAPTETSQQPNEDRRPVDWRHMGRHFGRHNLDSRLSDGESEATASGKGATADDPLAALEASADGAVDALDQGNGDAEQPSVSGTGGGETKGINAAAALAAGAAGTANARSGDQAPVPEPQAQPGKPGSDPAAAQAAVRESGARPGEAELAGQSGRAGKSQADRNGAGMTPVSESDEAVQSPSATATADAGTTATPPEKAKVVQQETHFAPVAAKPAAGQAGAGTPTVAADKAAVEASGGEAAATGGTAPTAEPTAAGSVATGLTLSQQIADGIADEVAAFDPAQQAAPAQVSGDAKPVLKVLQIQLQPAELGTVTVRMELKDTGLSLHVEAERAETADMLRADQDTLSKLLRSAGYGVDPSSIRVVEGDRSVTPAQAGQQGTQANLQSSGQSPQSQPGFSERQERGQRGSGFAQGDTQSNSNRNETHERTTARTGRGLYI